MTAELEEVMTRERQAQEAQRQEHGDGRVDEWMEAR
jgi:hypothetical protein